MKLEISMDDSFWVNLTQHGRTVLLNYYIDICRNDTNASPENFIRNRQDKGYYKFTIRELIKIFGNAGHCSANPFFDGKILLTPP